MEPKRDNPYRTFNHLGILTRQTNNIFLFTPFHSILSQCIGLPPRLKLWLLEASQRNIWHRAASLLHPQYYFKT